MPQAPTEPVHLPSALVDAAVAWTVRLHYNEPSPKDLEAFEHWLQADARHRVAWGRVLGLKGFRSELKSLPPKVAHDALRGAQTLRQRREGREGREGRRRAVKLLSLAGVAVVSGWAVRQHAPWQRLLADASTRVGEQKTLSLADGTVIVLNTDSAVSVDVSGAERLVVLHRGEVQITTGADSHRDPVERRAFWVDTPFGRLQALGTRFTVRLSDRCASVGVQDGAVALHPSNGSPSFTAHAGEHLRLTARGVRASRRTAFDPADWTQGVIAGQNMRLEDLLRELERYRHGRIVCDPRVADLRLSGLFHTRDTDQALQFLVQTQPVSVTYRTRFWVSVGPEQGG